MITAVSNTPSMAPATTLPNLDPKEQLTTFANDLQQVIMDMQALQKNPKLANESVFMQEFQKDMYAALGYEPQDHSSFPQSLQDLFAKFKRITNMPIGPNHLSINSTSSEASPSDFQSIFQDLLKNDPNTLKQWTSDFQDLYNGTENYLNSSANLR